MYVVYKRQLTRIKPLHNEIYDHYRGPSYAQPFRHSLHNWCTAGVKWTFLHLCYYWM